MSLELGAITPSAERVYADINGLACYAHPEQTGWTRQVFTEPYQASREYIRRTMEAAGLAVNTDRAGNIVGVLSGAHQSKPALVTGSHTDTVAGGGRFDGVVGVLGAVETVRILRENDMTLSRDLVVVDFLGEESNDYGLSCLGSRALAGQLDPCQMDRRDIRGKSLAERFTEFKLDPSDVLSERWLRTHPLHAYLEVHIEQGPVLEAAAVPIGIVTAISGIERLLASFHGRPDHSGTRPMGARQDALVAAARAVLDVQRTGCGAPTHGVATTTRLTSSPESPNVIPGHAQLRAEMRSIDREWLSTAKRQLADMILEHARQDGVEVSFDWTTDNEVTETSSSIQDLIAHSAAAVGLRWQPIPSGATHDAVHLSRHCRMGMIFIPSKDGRSHCPEEHSSIEDISAGIRVLAATIATLDRTEDVS